MHVCCRGIYSYPVQYFVFVLLMPKLLFSYSVPGACGVSGIAGFEGGECNRYEISIYCFPLYLLN